MGLPTSHQPKVLLKLVVFWTISTIQDEKSAAKFSYIKTISGKVVAQSIAFQVVINILAGGISLPPEILAPSDQPLLKAASFDTLCFVGCGPSVNLECTAGLKCASRGWL